MSGAVCNIQANMSPEAIESVRMVDPAWGIRRGNVHIEGGRIADIEIVARTGRPRHGGLLLTPGLIDMHAHGIGKWSYAQGSEALHAAARELPRFGVTTIAPTVTPGSSAQDLARLTELAESLPAVSGVNIPGLHLEGPFLTLPGAACTPVQGDIGLLEELLAACHGRVSAMSVSPDKPNILPVIERLCERGVRAFVTHTRATAEETAAAIEAGARHATHFYDGFPLPEETVHGVRPAGAVEAFLADPRTTVDFIADGIHAHPIAIRAAIAAKGWQGVALITDSNAGAEGSALTMDRGIANLLKWLDIPPARVWAMGTLNPARILGLTNKGWIEVGADADLALWDESLRCIKTWVGGKCVYEAV